MVLFIYLIIKLSFDLIIYFFSLINLDRKVIIVSVFGKSQYRSKCCKADMFSSVLQVDLLEEPIVNKNSLVKILNMYYGFSNIDCFVCNFFIF
jgi:hypothetical protein